MYLYIFKYLIDITYIISFMDIFLKAVLSALSKYPIWATIPPKLQDNFFNSETKGT